MTDLIALVEEERAAGPWAKEPHALGQGKMLPHFLVGQCGMPMTEVPSGFWSLDGATAVVSCPCGRSVRLAEERLVFDDNEFCERAFVYDGERVWCINSPRDSQSAPLAEPGVDVPEEPSADA